MRVPLEKRLLEALRKGPLPARFWHSPAVWRDVATRYGIALVLTAIATVLLSRSLLESSPFLILLGAVVLSAHYAGFGPALFSSALSVVVLLLLPGNRVPVGENGVSRIAVFIIISLLTAHLARQRSKEHRTAIEFRHRLAAIVESSHDAILSKDLTGTITSWNAAAEALYGYRAEEVIGKKVSLLAPPEKQQEIDDMMQRLHRGDRIGRLRTERVRKDGTRFFVSLSISPVHNAQGVVVGGASICHDVTAQIQTQNRLRGKEQELAAAYEHLRLAQQAAQIGTWEWDLAGGRLTWSAELERIHGLAPNTFGGHFENWLSAIHPDDRQRVRLQLLSAIQQARSCDVEYRRLRDDGSIAWTTARGAAYFTEEGQPRKLAGVGMDITERKLAEDSLRRSEKLAATGRLAASIAHEINNPLESVMNLVFLALNDPSLGDEAKRYLLLADKELVRMAHVAKQTLGFYRGSVSPVSLRLNEVLDQVLELYSRRLEAKQIVAEREYGDNAEISAFEGEVRQLFSNLIVNAIDALSPSGRLRVRVTRIATPRGTGVRVTIADNGRGIPRTQLKRIFEPFYTTKKEVGTGLGLWISQAIVEKHGGRVRVRSSVRPERCGTVFTVFLPQTATTEWLPAA